MAKEQKVYMPLMVGDWLKGTSGMKAEVKGVYINLLLHQWDHGFIPADIEELSLISPEINKVWDKLKVKFPESEPGKLQNIKLEEVRAFWKKQKKNGGKGGRPVKNNPNSNPEPNPNANPKHNHHNDIDLDNDIDLKNKNESVDFSDYEQWTNDVIIGNDADFEQMVMHQKFKNIEPLARSYLALLAQYPNKEPPDQHRFRIALIEHIRSNQNGSNGKQPANIIEERRRKFESGS